ESLEVTPSIPGSTVPSEVPVIQGNVDSIIPETTEITVETKVESPPVTTVETVAEIINVETVDTNISTVTEPISISNDDQTELVVEPKAES
ncbi:hypothetical protein ACXWSS_09825, partial [Streptococcus pyogenes]